MIKHWLNTLTYQEQKVAYHTRRTVYSLGSAACIGAIEPYTTTNLGTACGWLVIGAATGNAIRHGAKAVQAYRADQHAAQPTYPQFQYNAEGFSDRYNAEVEYLAYRATRLLDEMGVAEISTTDIAPMTRSAAVKKIADEMFETRLSEGYELSMHQICDGIRGAALSMGIYRPVPDITKVSGDGCDRRVE